MNRRAFIVIGLLALLSVFLRQELLLLISIFLALLVGAASLWSHFCLVALSYQRRLGVTHLYLGEETTLDMEIVNAKPLPLPWLRVDDAMPQTLLFSSQQLEEEKDGEQRRLVTVLSMRWYERVIRRYRVRGMKRGVWSLGPAQIRSGDIFGFDIRRLLDETSTSLLVYPRIVPVTALGFPARHPLGDLKNPRRVIEDPLRMMGVRDYVQGDNFRYIHWKATARSQTLQTKVFEPSANRPVAIFLNINTAEYFNDGYDLDLREFAISAAASLARQLWVEKQAVGLYINTMIRGSLHHVRLHPSAHPAQLEQLLTALAQIDDVRGRWRLETLLQTEATGLPYGATIVVVTAVLNQPLEQTLLDLRRREYAVVLITLGAAQLSRPLPNIQHHHIGGHEEWHALETIELVER
ncbi:MAG: DUF58 domain-containing protein [Caldilineaceae bacterium]